MNYKTVPTICVWCGCGCGTLLEVLDDKLVGTLPDRTHPISRGKLCLKGWNAHQFVHNEKRLVSPMIRSKSGRFQKVRWDEALDVVAGRLNEIKKKYGPDSIGVLSSAKCTNEENFLMMKFSRVVLGTNNIDHCARLCHASTVVGLATAFGSGAMTNSIPEIEKADCILITGSNTTEQHPLVATRIFKAKEKGARIILVDPRKIQMSYVSDIHLRPRPGTDVMWINGMMNVIIKEGLEDKAFIKQRTEGYEKFKEAVMEYSPERVEKITGICREDLIKAARIYATARTASIIFSMGITQHTTGTDNVLSLANLAMLTGNVGKEASGVNPLRGQQNVQGACDMGALPNVYSGYQGVSDEKYRNKFEEAWQTKLPVNPGLTVVEMMDAAFSGDIKAMYIMGENPAVSDPDINQVKKALNNLKFLAVQDIFLTETAQLADVVFPATSFAEKEGSFTATDRRVQKVRKAIDPPGQAKQDWEIICLLAKRLGSKEFNYSQPEELFTEIAQLTPIYQGMNYERLEANSLQWPCRSVDDPGTEYMHKESFTKGRGLFTPVEFAQPAELPDQDYPFILSTGRITFHFHTGSMSRISPALVREINEGFVEINPLDVKELGIIDGEIVQVFSRRGKIKIKAKLTDKVNRGIIFIPFHFVESAANVLTNPALDPRAKIPEYKVCAARVEKIKLAGKNEE
ncbi:MAG: formate dehydrogenase subunit alpha [Sedimentisphaerales bacterium]